MALVIRILSFSAFLMTLASPCLAQYCYSMGGGPGWNSLASGGCSNGASLGNRGTFGTAAGSLNTNIGNAGTLGSTPGTPGASSSNAGTLGTSSLAPVSPISLPTSSSSPGGITGPSTSAPYAPIVTPAPVIQTPSQPVVIQFAPPVGLAPATQ